MSGNVTGTWKEQLGGNYPNSTLTNELTELKPNDWSVTKELKTLGAKMNTSFPFVPDPTWCYAHM